MRLTMLAENEIVRRVKALVRLRDELKAVGQRFGSDSVITRRIFSNNAYDVELLNVTNSVRVVEVTFTPDNPNDPNTSLAYKMEYNGMTPDGYYVSDRDVQRFKPVNGVQKWRIYLQGNASPNTSPYWRGKFYFYTSGSGQFTAVEV